MSEWAWREVRNEAFRSLTAGTGSWHAVTESTMRGRAQEWRIWTSGACPVRRPNSEDEDTGEGEVASLVVCLATRDEPGGEPADAYVTLYARAFDVPLGEGWKGLRAEVLIWHYDGDLEWLWEGGRVLEREFEEGVPDSGVPGSSYGSRVAVEVLRRWAAAEAAELLWNDSRIAVPRASREVLLAGLD